MLDIVCDCSGNNVQRVYADLYPVLTTKSKPEVEEFPIRSSDESLTQTWGLIYNLHTQMTTQYVCVALVIQSILRDNTSAYY